MNLSFTDKSRHVNLFTCDPNLPGLDPEYHRGRFVRRTLWGKITRYSAPEVLLGYILYQLLAYFYSTAVDEAQYLLERERILNVVWPWLKPRLKHNKGLVEFMQHYGVHSRYYVPLLMYVPGALALCPAHGECMDIFGKPQKVPKSDAMYQFTQKDEMYAFARLRKNDAMSVLEKTQLALVLGAGTLQEVRQLRRFSAERLIHHEAPWLVAYDMDTKLQDYYDVVLDAPLAEYGVDLHYEDFRALENHSEYISAFEVIMALGVASYYYDRLEWFLGLMAKMLAPNGVIKFDMQILNGGLMPRKGLCRDTLMFDLFIMLWNAGLKPCKSPHDAYCRVKKVCAKVGLKIDYCKYDPNHPIGIIFQCSHV